MIDPTRQAILDELANLSRLTPDVRFGQLIANLSFLALGPRNESIWQVEDEQLLATIRSHAAVLREQSQAVA